MTPVCSIGNIGKREDSGNRKQESRNRNQESGFRIQELRKKPLAEAAENAEKKALLPAVFPTCLGPVRTTAGNWLNNDLRVVSYFLEIKMRIFCIWIAKMYALLNLA